MTREEEIQKAAREYSDEELARTCAYTDRTYEHRRTLSLFDASQIEQAFEDGVKWAYKHPAKKQTATIKAWICKDKNNKICNEKPYRNMVLECWSSGVSSITIPKEMFPNITWENSPKKVKVIIELEEELLDTFKMGNNMKKKKVTVIISYDYEDSCVVSNERIAERIKYDLVKGSDPLHERIESVTVKDVKSCNN